MIDINNLDIIPVEAISTQDPSTNRAAATAAVVSEVAALTTTDRAATSGKVVAWVRVATDRKAV